MNKFATCMSMLAQVSKMLTTFLNYDVCNGVFL